MSTSVVAIPFGYEFNRTTWNRTPVPTTPVQLLHLKIELLSCQTQVPLTFTETNLTQYFSYYTASPTETNLSNSRPYDQTVYINPTSRLMGKRITGNTATTSFTVTCPAPAPTFSPATLRAGTDEVLTITGTGFGATRGTGEVRFVNADNLALENYSAVVEYLSWTDTRITLKVPVEGKNKVGGMMRRVRVRLPLSLPRGKP